MIGTSLGHYRILDLLGEGGMGAVYRARDETLDREVALKVLPAELSADPDRMARFEREAKTLAVLDHPNIVMIHTVEQAEGVHFITMQLVEGEALSRLIPRGGASLQQILDVSIPLVDAVAMAHEKGVVHRDLKPANVMVSREGRIKVLDFGLAKTRRASTVGEVSRTLSEPLTEEGRVLGTVPYMSPEQLRGQEVDHLTDIFSIGVLLHQMATGRRPFAGVSEADLILSILSEEPPPLAELRPELPGQLDRIVGRCLEKDASRRYQSASDLLEDLEALRESAGAPQKIEAAFNGRAGRAPETRRAGAASGFPARGFLLGALGLAVAVGAMWVVLVGRGGQAPSPETGSKSLVGSTTQPAPSLRSNSIAVLPFADVSSDGDQEYFSDGIAEELMGLLSKVPELRVTSRTSAFSFKDKGMEIPEIASRLNVAYILEGSVRSDGDRVRVTARLIEADSDTPVWSDSYDRTLIDIFAIQDEIATDVVAQLKVTLLGKTPRAEEADPEAYALYLQARKLRQERTVESSERAIALLEEALRIDPVYASARAELSLLYWRRGNHGLMAADEACEAARQEANRALATDPDAAMAHARLGFFALTCDAALERSAEHLEQALALEPTHPEILRTSALLAWGLGRLDQALAILGYLVERDPFSPAIHFSHAMTFYFAERWDEAVASTRRVLALNPEHPGARFIMGVSLLNNAEPEAALDAIEQETLEAARWLGQVLVYHALGQQERSDEVLADLIRRYGDSAAYNIALTLAYRKETDRAFQWLDRALRINDPGLSQIAVEPGFSHLHSDPRWLPLLEKIGKSPDRLAAVEFHVTLPTSLP